MKTYHTLYSKFDQGFIGYVTLAVLTQTCLGSVAAMAILQNGTNPVQMFQLFIVVVSCMFFNQSVMAQQTHKMIFNLFLFSIGANTILAAINFLQ